MYKRQAVGRAQKTATDKVASAQGAAVTAVETAKTEAVQACLLYTSDNGLLMPWEGRVWLNPPYGNEAEAFMELMSMHQGGGLALIFMRSDTRWFQRCVLHLSLIHI